MLRTTCSFYLKENKKNTVIRELLALEASISLSVKRKR